MEKEFIGIIVEFNPMHNGHKHLIDYIKKENQDAILMASMSGNFVQRGELAIYDKWTRAEYAIENGVDLVVELPPFFVLNHANIFARKSVELLNSYGVKKIYFGTEGLEIKDIEVIVDVLMNNESELEEIKKELHSLPKAFSKLIGRELNPNDTLGICYVLEAKKLGLNIEFHRIPRECNDEYVSASSIRESILEGKSNDHSLIKDEVIFNLDEYTDIVLGKLMTTSTDDSVINYLKNKAKNNYNTISELIDDSHNKSFTKSRLRRELVKFVLELEGSSEEIVLAMNNNGKEILKNVNHYSFRHNKQNQDNEKVENFISIKGNESLEELLSKRTIIK